MYIYIYIYIYFLYTGGIEYISKSNLLRRYLLLLNLQDIIYNK